MTETLLQIKHSDAVKAYQLADTSTRKVLTALLGGQSLTMNITERVRDFADVLAIAGRDASEFEPRQGETIDELATRKLKLVAEVYNEGTKLDPMDTSQYKYYPWHKIDKSSGFGLSFDDFGYWHSATLVGSRLCFKNEELAIDAGKKFIELYAQMKIQ